MNNPVIVIAAYNRPYSLKRLLFSLSNAVFEFYPLLIVSIDGNGSDEIISMAKEYRWNGDKKVIIHSENLGLKDHILFCGNLSKEYDHVIILEDDLFVSPYFYDYACESALFYKDEDQIAGISLYQYEYIENTDLPFVPVHNGFDTYCVQMASSWGQMWSKEQWQQFYLWYENHKDWEANDSRLPDDIFKWPDTSWKKYFIKYLVNTNKFLVYPNISLTTNFGDVGTHNGYDNSLHQVNLLIGKKVWNFASISNAIKYDVNFNLIGFSIPTGTLKSITDNPASQMRPVELSFLLGLENDDTYLDKKKDSDYRTAFNLSSKRIQTIQNELPPLRKQVWSQAKYWFKKMNHIFKNERD